jgi:hypothetical protein
MKLRGGDWSKGDVFAGIACLAAVLAIPGMPRLFHLDSDSHGQAATPSPTQSLTAPATTSPGATEEKQTQSAHLATPLSKHQQQTQKSVVDPKRVDIGAGAQVNAHDCAVVGIVDTLTCNPPVIEPHISWVPSSSEMFGSSGNPKFGVAITADKFIASPDFVLTCDAPCHYFNMGLAPGMSSHRYSNLTPTTVRVTFVGSSGLGTGVMAQVVLESDNASPMRITSVERTKD